MKKGTKIAIGIGSALAVGAATAGVLYAKNRKKNTKEEKNEIVKKEEKKAK